MKSPNVVPPSPPQMTPRPGPTGGSALNVAGSQLSRICTVLVPPSAVNVTASAENATATRHPVVIRINRNIRPPVVVVWERAGVCQAEQYPAAIYKAPE